jgi:hypothetical protein
MSLRSSGIPDQPRRAADFPHRSNAPELLGEHWHERAARIPSRRTDGSSAAAPAATSWFRALAGLWIDIRHALVLREAHTLALLDRLIVFIVVALEPGIAVHRLAGAHEAEARVAERDAVVAVPAVQHRSFTSRGIAQIAVPRQIQRGGG